MNIVQRRIAALFALFACPSAAAIAQPKPAGPPYKIGVILPLTGPGAAAARTSRK